MLQRIKGSFAPPIAVVLATVLAAATSAFAGTYDDAACRKGAGWATDACVGKQWGAVAVNTPAAWEITRGAGTTVAVVDTGVDFRHPDLAANLVAAPGSNLIENTRYRCPFDHDAGGRSSTAVAQDDNGHGTHVAGIIGALAGNRYGVAGVAPDARILPVKVLDGRGSGRGSTVARGICFAADHGADVINLSLGFDPVVSIVVQGLGSDVEDAIEYAYAKGAAVVIAAGNDTFPACSYPASASKALCVGAVDRDDRLASYSNFGDRLDVVAPGGAGGGARCANDAKIWSTVWPGAKYDCGNDGFEALAGTSMAAPHAAAVAALVKARYGSRATPAFVYDRLKETADDLGPAGPDAQFAYGRVNAARAVGGAGEAQPDAPESEAGDQVLPPSAPQGLEARSGDRRVRVSVRLPSYSATASDGAGVELSWGAPRSNGGSALVGYRVYRRTADTSLQAVATTTETSFQDRDAERGVRYYYRVSALNEAGEGAVSNEASAVSD